MPAAKAVASAKRAVCAHLRTTASLAALVVSFTAVFFSALRSRTAAREGPEPQLVAGGSGGLDDLPVVDLACLRSATGPRWAAGSAALVEAARGRGLARLAGHGVDVEAARRAGRDYFALPAHLKGCPACSLRNETVGLQRGYISVAGESGLADVVEMKEGFSYGLEWPQGRPSAHPFQTPNTWPPEEALALLGPGWRAAMEGFFNATVKVSQTVVAALAASLDAQRQAQLVELCRGGETISQMRLFHYLPPAAAPGKQYMGSSPHTDWHVVTIILRDMASTLQFVDHRTGDWKNVTMEEDELLLLVGDWLSIFSGEEFHSAPHRVQLPEAQSSLAFVLFFYPSPDARLPPASMEVTTKSRGHEVLQRGHLNTVEQSLFELAWGEYVVQKWVKVMSNR